jgi:hypothetical protein
VEGSYPEEQIEALKQNSKEVLMFPRQAESTSTTNIIEKTMKNHLDTMLKYLSKNGKLD